MVGGLVYRLPMKPNHPKVHVLAFQPLPGERAGATLRAGKGDSVQRAPQSRAAAQGLDRGEYITLRFLGKSAAGIYSGLKPIPI